LALLPAFEPAQLPEGTGNGRGILQQRQCPRARCERYLGASRHNPVVKVIAIWMLLTGLTLQISPATTPRPHTWPRKLKQAWLWLMSLWMSMPAVHMWYKSTAVNSAAEAGDGEVAAIAEPRASAPMVVLMVLGRELEPWISLCTSSTSASGRLFVVPSGVLSAWDIARAGSDIG
jgi:hypothetical protein